MRQIFKIGRVLDGRDDEMCAFFCALPVPQSEHINWEFLERRIKYPVVKIFNELKT